MPRIARIKHNDGIYHIMIRSISEILLFKEDGDKDKYIELIRKYKYIYGFKLYAYCFMDNHAHFLIDSHGKDISKIMHCINQCYSMYYNRKYNRRGHVFADRFKSVLINDNRQLLTTSAYIHNNPKDLHGYADSVERYKYSSLYLYIDDSLNLYGIIDTSFILDLYSNNLNSAKLNYLKFVKARLGKDISEDIEFKNEPTEYRSEKRILLSNITENNIIDFVSKYTNEKLDVRIKFNHKNSELKSICVLLMRSLCNYSYKNICQLVGNMSLSSISSLCNRGLFLILNKYTSLVNDLLLEYSY